MDLHVEGLDSGTSPSSSMVPTPRSEALPAKAAEKQKLVGCTVLRPHAGGKMTPLDPLSPQGRLVFHSSA